MAIIIGPKQIVNSDLVLHLDSSYPSNYILDEVEYLVVAGGGGGGSADQNTSGNAGGGGAGGFRTGMLQVTPGTAITVTVGNGGAGGAQATSNTGSNGQNSIFGTITSIGGGKGSACSDLSPGSGGSGGGASGCGYAVGSGTPGQGYAGGNSVINYSPAIGGGGGGGAGGPGRSGSGQLHADGGPGKSSSISGTPTYYAGGGGAGGTNEVNAGGKGGVGGGGNGGWRINTGYRPAGTPGTPNTGGGGGAGGSTDGASHGGGAGGSGIVIVRYPGPQKATGGNTITSSGGYTIHTFTSSGTFTPLAAPANSGAVYGLQDLSGNGNTGTQSGGVTYSSANGGSLTFDGTNDIITITSTGIVTNNISVDIWFNVNSAKAYTALLGSNATEKYEMLIKTASNLEISLAPGNYIQHNNILSINTWTNIVVSASNGVAWKVYKNGVDLGTPPVIAGSYQISGTGVSNIDQGRIRNDVGSFAFSGNIASTKIYNKALTAAEISQNFNALRGRFGI